MRAKTNKNFTKTIKVQECFKYILGDHYTYLCYYGGRGGGKSESIAQMLVLRAYNEPRLRILCMRETQNTIADSVKSILEKWIHSLDLSSEFKIKTDKIEANNGSTFLFKGMQEYNAGNIKSIADINITWIEEAQYFSERSWELLVPSVIRAKFFILYSLFFILYSLFFILYSLFFILYSLFFRWCCFLFLLFLTF